MSRFGAPKVSICVVTYNQEDYIQKCLDSIVIQAVDFDFEIIIGDDFSTDNTREIVSDFANRYPEIVKAVFHDKNLGPFENYLLVHELARGEYIAHIDGDDYFLPGKLQAQVDYLDSHPDVVMVFHGCMTLHVDGKLNSSLQKRPIIKAMNFAQFMYLYPSKSWHSAKMYRRSANKDFDWRKRRFIDKHLHFFHGLSGLVGFINEDLVVYRVGVGMSSNVDAIQELALDSYKFAADLGYDKHTLRKIVAREHFEHGLRSLSAGNYLGFRRNVWRGVFSGHITLNSVLALSFSVCPKCYLRVRTLVRSIVRGLASK